MRRAVVRKIVPYFARGAVWKGASIARHTRACQQFASSRIRGYQTSPDSSQAYVLNNPFEKPKTQIEIMIRDAVGGLEVGEVHPTLTLFNSILLPTECARDI
jgi:hypothetical protein